MRSLLCDIFILVPRKQCAWPPLAQLDLWRINALSLRVVRNWRHFVLFFGHKLRQSRRRSDLLLHLAIDYVSCASA